MTLHTRMQRAQQLTADIKAALTLDYDTQIYRHARTLAVVRTLWESRRLWQERTEQAREGGKFLGKAIAELNDIALDATGMHDAIDENRNGDWQAVWENVSDLGERCRLAERRIAELETTAIDLLAAHRRIAELESERDIAISAARGNSHALDEAKDEIWQLRKQIAFLEEPPRQIETAAQLDALPIETVVLAVRSRTTWENIAERDSLWANCGAALTAANLLHNYGAVVVVWTPELEAQVQQ